MRPLTAGVGPSLFDGLAWCSSSSISRTTVSRRLWGRMIWDHHPMRRNYEVVMDLGALRTCCLADRSLYSTDWPLVAAPSHAPRGV